MSQRRAKLPRAGPAEILAGAVRSYTIKVVCTDRGQHPAVVINHLRDTRGDPDLGNRVMWQDGPLRKPPLTISDPQPGDEGSFRFRCRRCGRDTQLRHAAILRIIGLLQAGQHDGHPVLDVSLLPCLAMTRLTSRVGGARPAV